MKARPVVGTDGDVVRIVGTLSDITESKTSEERLLHDAVHDNLTGLPNRELFFDRLDAALTLAQTESKIRPTVISIDIDRFKQINEASGLSAGDSILLTLARRLSRMLKPQDTLARLSGDQFAALIVSENETRQITALANMVRRVASTPVTFSDKEIPLTASIGVALYDPQLHAKREDMLKDAEIAMRHGKRLGGNRIEVFRATMRSLRSDRLGLAADLRKALDRNEIKVYFSRSSGSRTARSRASKRCCAGTIRASGGSIPANSFRSPKRPGPSSISAFSRWSAPRANLPPGNARSTSIRRFSPASMSLRANCSATISCRTSRGC